MRALPDLGFSRDDGTAEPHVAAAFAEVAAGAGLEVAVAAVCASRLLVPVVAVSGDGRRDSGDSTADIAAVLLTGRDGRRALLAFTSQSTMQAWDPAARPVPIATVGAAQAALAQGADALVVDVAGPTQLPIEAATLRRVAGGQRLMRASDGWAWTAPVSISDEGAPLIRARNGPRNES